MPTHIQPSLSSVFSVRHPRPSSLLSPPLPPLDLPLASPPSPLPSLPRAPVLQADHAARRPCGPPTARGGRDQNCFGSSCSTAQVRPRGTGTPSKSSGIAGGGCTPCRPSTRSRPPRHRRQLHPTSHPPSQCASGSADQHIPPAHSADGSIPNAGIRAFGLTADE